MTKDNTIGIFCTIKYNLVTQCAKYYPIYNKIKLIIFCITVSFAFTIGYMFGYVIDSGLYRKINTFLQKHELAALLFNPSDWFLDAFEVSIAIAFAVYGITMFIYTSDSNMQDNINSKVKFINSLGTKPGALIMMLGSTIFGTAVYGWMHHGINVVIAPLVIGVVLLGLGFILKKSGTLYTKGNSFLNSYSKMVSLYCFIISSGFLIHTFIRKIDNWLTFVKIINSG